MKILIVGTGRCGTNFFARSLEESGRSCGHEAVFNHWNESRVRDAYARCRTTAESAWPAAPFIGKPWLDPDLKIVHLLRAPMKVIESFYDIDFFSAAREQKPLNQIVYANTSISAATQHRLISAVHHYFEWNSLIRDRLALAPNPRFTIRLEQLVEEDNAKRAALEDFLGFALPLVRRVINDKREEKANAEAEPFDRERALAHARILASDFGSFGYEL